MADKIPYEVLLPVALELFQKVPFPEISIEEDYQSRAEGKTYLPVC